MTKRIRVWREGDKVKGPRKTAQGLARQLQATGRNSVAIDALVALECCDLIKGKITRWMETTLKGAGAAPPGTGRSGGMSDIPKETRCSLAIQDVSQQLQRILTENDDA